jgi:hypothetical protein
MISPTLIKLIPLRVILAFQAVKFTKLPGTLLLRSEWR